MKIVCVILVLLGFVAGNCFDFFVFCVFCCCCCCCCFWCFFGAVVFIAAAVVLLLLLLLLLLLMLLLLLFLNYQHLSNTPSGHGPYVLHNGSYQPVAYCSSLHRAHPLRSSLDEYN